MRKLGLRRWPWAFELVAVAGVLTACGSSSAPTPGSSPSSASTTSARSSASAGVTSSPTPADLVDVRLQAMDDAQKAGQLFMVGGAASGVPAATMAAVTTYHVGSVFLSGRSSAGVTATATTVAALQALATADATAGTRLFVATDQEGGQVQVLKGPGFSTIPSAVTQSTTPPATLQQQAAGWGSELAAAGVNVDLAPVADLVPPGGEAANPPVGAYARNYGTDPAVVASSVAAFVQGMEQAGVSTTVKHFPGLGRVDGNTDTSSNVVDRVTSTTDASLHPFAAGIAAGADLVMVSLATYELIDPSQPAVFSPTVITTLLRGQLGYTGVVVTDDVGAAAQVQSVPPGERATRFLAAGGDVVLTVDPGLVPEMTQAVVSRMAADPGFRVTVDAAVRRVLVAKQARGLL